MSIKPDGMVTMLPFPENVKSLDELTAEKATKNFVAWYVRVTEGYWSLTCVYQVCVN